MSCHSCMEPALPWRACFHAWGRWESVETLRHVRRSRSSWCECTEHMPEGRSSSGCGVGFMQSLLEDLWDREWQCHLCLSVHCNTTTLRFNWLNPGEFQTLPPSFHRKAFIMRGYFQSTKDTLPHRKESKVPFPEDIQIGFSDAGSFMWAESLWHQKHFDRGGEESSPQSNLEDTIFTCHEFYLSNMNLESFV